MIGHRFRPWLVSLFILALTALSQPGTDAAVEKRPRTMIWIINHVSWSDLWEAQAPRLHGFIRDGAVGLLNVKNKSGFLAASSFLTMGMSEPDKA